MSNKSTYFYSPSYRKAKHLLAYKVAMATAALLIWAAVIVGGVAVN